MRDFNFFVFNFSLQFTEFRSLKFVGPRTKVHLLDEGYAYEPKSRDLSEISSKSSENPMFRFFSDLRGSDGQNLSDQELKLLYAMGATRGY